MALALGVDSATGASIETNKDDYMPGEVVHLTGRGWAPGEVVNLYMTEDPDTHGPVSQDVTADSAGGFSLHFYDVQEHDLGATFTLTATGLTSGSRAVVTFVDAQLDLTIATNLPSGVLTSLAYALRQSTCTNSPNGSGTWTFGTSSPVQLQNNRYLTFTIPSVPGYTYTGYSWTGATSVTPASSASNTTLCVQGSNDAITGTLTLNFTAASVATSTAISSSVTPSVTGQSTTFTATVTAGVNPVTTGSVTFKTGGTSCSDATTLAGPTALDGSGQATASAPFDASDSPVTVRACHGGASGFNTSDASLTQTITKAATTITLASSVSPSSVGQTVTFTPTVSVTSPGAGTPTGTVELFEFTLGQTCASHVGAVALGSAAVGGTINVSTLAAGNHSLTACYSGDADFAASGSATLTQSVNLVATALQLTSSVNPSVFGQSVTFTATLTANSAALSGVTITFHLSSDCSGAAVASGTTNAAGQVTYTRADLTVGSHDICAKFAGNATYATDQDALAQQVNKAATSLALSTSNASVYFGASVTFTAVVSVTAPGAGTPTGSVNFYSSGSCVSPVGSLGSGTLSSSGTNEATATLATSALNAGNYNILACYGGDGSFSGDGDTEAQEVQQATTTLSLSTSGTPSYFGDNVTFTAALTVTNGVANLAGGTVNFSAGGTCQANGSISGGTSLGSGTIADNSASVSSSTLDAGTYTIVACSGGNANVAGSGDSKQQVVNPAETETSVTSTPNPSTFGASVTFSATVAVQAGKGSGTPTGNVDFRLATSCATGTSLGTAALVGGSASMSGVYSQLTVTGSPHGVIACYSPSSTNFTGSSGSDTHTVQPAATTVTLTIASSPVQYSDRINLAASVTPTSLNGQTLTGSVQFRVNGSNVGSAQTIDASGNASLTGVTITLAPGTYNVDAVFTSTNANFAGDTDTNSLTVTQEDARITYTGLYSFSFGTASSVTVPLSATVQDITTLPSDPAYDAYAGDIRNARVTFYADGNAISACTNLAPSLVTAADTKTGTVACNATFSSPSSPMISMVVSAYYTRSYSGDNVTISVAPSTTGFITGGGYLVNATSAGQVGGTTGARTNLGFNVKYNKSKTNLQGQVNIIVRRLESDGWHTYQVKSTSITTLQSTITSPTTGTATFTSKANITDITNPLAPTLVCGSGNCSLTMTLADKGEPGVNDRVGITVYNGSALAFSSAWTGVKTVEQTIAGGNLQVR